MVVTAHDQISAHCLGVICQTLAAAGYAVRGSVCLHLLCPPCSSTPCVPQLTNSRLVLSRCDASCRIVLSGLGLCRAFDKQAIARWHHGPEGRPQGGRERLHHGPEGRQRGRREHTRTLASWTGNTGALTCGTLAARQLATRRTPLPHRPRRSPLQPGAWPTPAPAAPCPAGCCLLPAALEIPLRRGSPAAGCCLPAACSVRRSREMQRGDDEA